MRQPPPDPKGPTPEATVAEITKNNDEASEPEETGRRAQRVAHIVELKLGLRYTCGTAKRLADEWGLSQEYVRVLACEANKVVRRQVTDPDAIAAELLPETLRSFRAMSRFVRDRDLDPHARAKMASSLPGMGNLLADVAGLKAPKRTEFSGPDGGPLQVTGPTIFIPPESDD